MAKRDWNAIKTEYITGRESLQKLADKHEIPLRTVKDRSRKEGWTKERQNYRTEIAQKSIRKTAKKELKRLEKLRGAAEDVADLIKEDIEQLKEMHRKREFLTEADIKMIKDLTIALKNIADIMRDVYAIPTIREQLMLDKYEDYRKALEEAEADEGGVILLADILEKEAAENGESAMEATAEAGGISATPGV